MPCILHSIVLRYFFVLLPRSLRSTACLQYPPEQIAVAVIFQALRHKRMEVKQCPERRTSIVNDAIARGVSPPAERPWFEVRRGHSARAGENYIYINVHNVVGVHDFMLPRCCFRNYLTTSGILLMVDFSSQNHLHEPVFALNRSKRSGFPKRTVPRRKISELAFFSLSHQQAYFPSDRVRRVRCRFRPAQAATKNPVGGCKRPRGWCLTTKKDDEQ